MCEDNEFSATANYNKQVENTNYPSQNQNNNNFKRFNPKNEEIPRGNVHQNKKIFNHNESSNYESEIKNYYQNNNKIENEENELEHNHKEQCNSKNNIYQQNYLKGKEYNMYKREKTSPQEKEYALSKNCHHNLQNEDTNYLIAHPDNSQKKVTTYEMYKKKQLNQNNKDKDKGNY